MVQNYKYGEDKNFYCYLTKNVV